MSTGSTRPDAIKARPKSKTPAPRPASKHTSMRIKTIGAAATSKQGRVIALLRTASGGSIEQLTKLTGWQPHTVRGTISSVLRNRIGLKVSSEVLPSGVRAYRIVESRR